MTKRTRRVAMEGGKVEAVSARDLHAEMGVQTAATTWFDRCAASLGLVAGRDYVAEATDGRRGSRRDAWLRPEAADRIATANAARPTRRRGASLARGAAEAARTDPSRVPPSGTGRGDADGLGPEAAFPEVTQRMIAGRVQLAVDARDLHATLGVRTEEVRWIRRRIAQLGLREGIDYEATTASKRRELGVSTRTDEKARTGLRGGKNAGGRPMDVYVLTLEAAKHVTMAEHTPVGRAIRRYFIACETRLAEIAAATVAAETARLEAEVARLSVERGAHPVADDLGAEHGSRSPDGDLLALVERLAALPGTDVAFVGRMLDLVAAPAATRPARDAATHDPDGAGATTGRPDVSRPDNQGDRAGEAGRRPTVAPAPAVASATQGGANAAADERPRHLHRTSVGVVIDLRLPITGSAESDRLAVCAAFGTRPFDKRTITVWQTNFRRLDEARAGAVGDGTPARGIGLDPARDGTGTTMETRRAIVEAYQTVRAERTPATLAHRKAERDAMLREAVAARWAKVRGEVN